MQRKGMKMKAAVVNKVLDDYKLEQVFVDEPQINEVRVKMVASGICHSDEAFRLNEAPYQFPAILGHEGSGIVEKVGSAVTNVKVGDHVIVSYAYCGECGPCRVGRVSTCDNWAKMNFGRRIDGSAVAYKEDGSEISNILGQNSFAEYAVVDHHNVTKVSDKFDLRLAGPLGCGFLTGAGTVLNGLKPEIGSSLAVFGTGTVGIAAMMAAKASGCTTIIAIDIHDHRLKTALELAATHTINSKKVDVLEEIKKITGGGCNYVIDTTGVTSVMKLALDATALPSNSKFIPIDFKRLTIDSMTDEDPKYKAINAINNNPSNFWHTKTRNGKPKELVIKVDQTVNIKKIVYYPRDFLASTFKKFEILFSNDGINYIHIDNYIRPRDNKKIIIDISNDNETKYIKFIITQTHDSDFNNFHACASLINLYESLDDYISYKVHDNNKLIETVRLRKNEEFKPKDLKDYDDLIFKGFEKIKLDDKNFSYKAMYEKKSIESNLNIDEKKTKII